MNKNKKKILTVLCGVALSLGSVGAYVKNAEACCVSDFGAWSVVPQLALLQTNLNMLFAGTSTIYQSIYAINENTTAMIKGKDINTASKDKNDRATISQKIRMQRDFNRLPDAAGCSEATAGGGRAGGAAAAKKNAKTLQDTVLTKQMTTDNENEKATEMLRQKLALGTCTAEDVTRKKDGCTAAGAMPGADRDAKTLTIAATRVGEATNHSFDDKQQKAAENYIYNIAGMPMNKLPVADENNLNTYGGYVANQYVNNARTSVSTMILSNIASLRYANPSLTNYWSTISSKFSELFPNDKVVTAPSEYERIRYEVFSRYADSADADSWLQQTATMTSEEGLREIMRMRATGLYLDLLKLERLEDGNVGLATILAHELNPVSKSIK